MIARNTSFKVKLSSEIRFSSIKIFIDGISSPLAIAPTISIVFTESQTAINSIKVNREETPE